MIAQFKAGEIDILTNGIPADLRDQLVTDTPDAQHNEWIDAGMGQIGVNMARPPFDDLRVRKAVSMAIDREGQGSTIWIGGTVPSNVCTGAVRLRPARGRALRAAPVRPRGGEGAAGGSRLPRRSPSDADRHGRLRGALRPGDRVHRRGPQRGRLQRRRWSCSTTRPTSAAAGPTVSTTCSSGRRPRSSSPTSGCAPRCRPMPRELVQHQRPGARRHARRAADDPRSGRAGGEDQGDPALRAGERDEPDPDVDVPHAVELRPRARGTSTATPRTGSRGIEAAWLEQ